MQFLQKTLWVHYLYLGMRTWIRDYELAQDPLAENSRHWLVSVLGLSIKDSIRWFPQSNYFPICMHVETKNIGPTPQEVWAWTRSSWGAWHETLIGKYQEKLQGLMWIKPWGCFETSLRIWQVFDMKKHFLPAKCVSLRSSQVANMQADWEPGW